MGTEICLIWTGKMGIGWLGMKDACKNGNGKTQIYRHYKDSCIVGHFRVKWWKLVYKFQENWIWSWPTYGSMRFSFFCYCKSVINLFLGKTTVVLKRSYKRRIAFKSKHVDEPPALGFFSISQWNWDLILKKAGKWI
jgi:hypothetical protein